MAKTTKQKGVIIGNRKNKNIQRDKKTQQDMLIALNAKKMFTMLIECRDMLILMTLIDRSRQCAILLEKVESLLFKIGFRKP